MKTATMATHCLPLVKRVEVKDDLKLRTILNRSWPTCTMPGPLLH